MGLTSDLLRELEAADADRQQDPDRYLAALEQAIDAADVDSTSTELLDVDGLRLDLSEQYQRMGRYDDALAVVDAAIAAGIEMTPDPRCLRAEVLVRAGRIQQAEPIWAAVLADTPDDAWLYNNAGLEYHHAGEHQRALGWLTDGLRLALRTGDPERLADLRRSSLEQLGRPEDELQGQAAEFLRTPAKPTASAAATWRDLDAVDAFALAWFPAGDYERALKLWPDFAGSELVNGPGGQLPHDPPDARAAYAGHLGALGDPGVVRFPPGRNEPCWCGSGRKYKKCCAAPSDVVGPGR